MNPRRKPWYKTRWGFLPALVISPFWLIWKLSRRNRLPRVMVGGTYALIAFVLIVMLIGHLFSDNAVKSPSNAATSNAISGNPSVALSGYGATLTEWNASHTEDTHFSANSSYDPTSGLGNGYTDKYTSVLFSGGRSLGYQIGFPTGTSIASAVNAVMQGFPPDTTILWQQENTSDSVNVCYQMEVHNATLAQALENSGNVFIEFQTIETSDTSTAIGYYANNVNNASLRNVDYNKASQSGGC